MKKDTSICMWCIPKFPRNLKNRFLAACKEIGVPCRILLADVIREWLLKRKRRGE